jgi:hypothetical protein
MTPVGTILDQEIDALDPRGRLGMTGKPPPPPAGHGLK